MDEEITNQKETISVSEKPKRPGLVTIFSILMIIDGVIALFGAVVFLILGGVLLGGAGIVLAILAAIIGFAKIAIGRGLRGMRRWTLKLLSVITGLGLLSLAYSYLNNSMKTEDLLSTALNVIVLFYLWSIRDKFVY